jgi:long-chain acyl-CoA synthetase
MLHVGPHTPVTYLAADAKNVGDLFRRRAKKTRTKAAFYEKHRGSWKPTTWGQFYERAKKAARGIQKLGLEPGDRLAILGPTKSPWGTFDLGSQLSGMVSFGIYPKQAVEQIHYLLEHSEAKLVFVDGQDELDSVLKACEGLERVEHIVPWSTELFEANASRDDRITSPAGFEEEPLDDEEIDRILAAVDPDDTAILVYTSGTTGPPKAAMISHANILAVLRNTAEIVEFFEDDVTLSFLPMAHVAERIAGFYGRVSSGVTTAFASSIATVLDDLQEVQPTLFGSVPRIYEKAYAKIHTELEKKPPLVQKIFAAARDVAREAAAYKTKEEPLPFPLNLEWALFDKIIYSKVRGAFGGRVRWSMTGAAPIAIDILEFFWGAGIPIYEAYGMTEATVITHANRPGSVKLGTVGVCADAMEAKIADDGEVLMRGPFVFKGYFKNDGATQETVVDGWLHTGDIGEIDDEGYLRITDRKKHLIITAGGKNLAPANIENAIKNQSPLISQVHAHGDKRKFISAIVAPSPIETLELGVKHGVVTDEELAERTEELMANPSGRTEALNEALGRVVVLDAFEDAIRAAVRAGNEHLANVEKVRRFAILDRDFSQEQGELTPTMKLKRKSVEDKYAELFDRIYDEEGFGLEP